MGIHKLDYRLWLVLAHIWGAGGIAGNKPFMFVTAGIFIVMAIAVAYIEIRISTDE